MKLAKVYPGVYPVVYFDCFFTQGGFLVMI